MVQWFSGSWLSGSCILPKSQGGDRAEILRLEERLLTLVLIYLPYKALKCPQMPSTPAPNPDPGCVQDSELGFNPNPDPYQDSELGSVNPALFLSVYLLLYPMLQWIVGDEP